MQFSTRANGKLLLTGEYFVTEGAVALALPTKLGQRLEVETTDNAGILDWKSYDHEGGLWFSGEFSLKTLNAQSHTDSPAGKAVAEVLSEILQGARRLNPQFLPQGQGLAAITHLEFPNNWGLGSSSTLVSMIAEWAEVDAYALLDLTMGGSGYDIAAARADKPILFQKFNGQNRTEAAQFEPSFKSNLYFVHLGHKQNSRHAMVYYTTTPPEKRHIPLGRISQITHNVNAYLSRNPNQTPLQAFEQLLNEHEQIVAGVIQQPLAKHAHFDDFWGSIKSLGAWGGDFVLATSDRSEAETRAYFAEKGYATVLGYDELIK